MKFFQGNMQTGILVLLVVLVAIVCVALFFTNKEVRNIKAGVVKSRHDINAIQTLLNDVGLTASGGHLDDESLIDQKGGPPQSRFMGIPSGMPQGMPANISMFPPGMVPPELRPEPTADDSEHSATLPTSSPTSNAPEPLPADTTTTPATLNLEKPTDQKEPDVIPPEDVEVVNSENKDPTKVAEKSPVKSQQKQEEEEESSEEETDSDEESETDDE